MTSKDVISVRVSSIKKDEDSLESDPLDKLSKDYSQNASELHKDAQEKINQINELLDEIKDINDENEKNENENDRVFNNKFMTPVEEDNAADDELTYSQQLEQIKDTKEIADAVSIHISHENESISEIVQEDLMHDHLLFNKVADEYAEQELAEGEESESSIVQESSSQTESQADDETPRQFKKVIAAAKKAKEYRKNGHDELREFRDKLKNDMKEIIHDKHDESKDNAQDSEEEDCKMNDLEDSLNSFSQKESQRKAAASINCAQYRKYKFEDNYSQELQSEFRNAPKKQLNSCSDYQIESSQRLSQISKSAQDTGVINSKRKHILMSEDTEKSYKKNSKNKAKLMMSQSSSN